jgi:hypothetical protein
LRWALAVALTGSPALARENLETERLLAEVIQQGVMEVDGTIPPSQGWAVLPQVGYSPEKGANGGVKFTDRNATPARLTIDLEGGYALKKQQNVSLAIVAPHFFEDQVIVALQAEYGFDPTKEFFGLGNNNIGPDPLSTNAYKPLSVLSTVALRPFPRLTAALTIGANHVHIGQATSRGRRRRPRRRSRTSSAFRAVLQPDRLLGRLQQPRGNHAADARLEPHDQGAARQQELLQRLLVHPLHRRRQLSLPVPHAAGSQRAARRRRVHRLQEPRHALLRVRRARPRTCAASFRTVSSVAAA